MDISNKEFITDLINLYRDPANTSKELIFYERDRKIVDTSNLDAINFDMLYISMISNDSLNFRDMFCEGEMNYDSLRYFVSNKIHLTDYFINKYELVKIVEEIQMQLLDANKKFIPNCRALIEPQGTVDFNDYSVKYTKRDDKLQMSNLYRDAAIISNKFKVECESKILESYDPITDDMKLYLRFRHGDSCYVFCDLVSIVVVCYRYKISIPKWFWDQYGINDMLRHECENDLANMNPIRELVRLPILTKE